MYRIAAEERINDLQSLVDQTFQQFALDDSEDDDIDDLLSDEGSEENMLPRPNNLESHSANNLYQSSLPAHVRHIRSNSTHFDL